MGQISAKLRSLEGGRVAFWCPGCEEIHAVAVGKPGRPNWTFDGNVDAPTFSPSILVRYDHWVPPATPENMNRGPQTKVAHVCHSFVRSGRIEFLGDCTHAFAGKTVPIPDLPDFLKD